MESNLKIKTETPSIRRRLWMGFRRLVLGFFLLFGTEFKDQRTGKSLGKGLVFSFRGKVHVIGLFRGVGLRPKFLPQSSLRYWKQELGFDTHPPADEESTDNY